MQSYNELTCNDATFPTAISQSIQANSPALQANSPTLQANSPARYPIDATTGRYLTSRHPADEADRYSTDAGPADADTNRYPLLQANSPVRYPIYATTGRYPTSHHPADIADRYSTDAGPADTDTNHYPPPHFTYHEEAEFPAGEFFYPQIRVSRGIRSGGARGRGTRSGKGGRATIASPEEVLQPDFNDDSMPPSLEGLGNWTDVEIKTQISFIKEHMDALYAKIVNLGILDKNKTVESIKCKLSSRLLIEVECECETRQLLTLGLRRDHK